MNNLLKATIVLSSFIIVMYLSYSIGFNTSFETSLLKDTLQYDKIDTIKIDSNLTRNITWNKK